MNFDPLKGVIQINPEEAKSSARYLLHAIKQIKKSAGMPLTPYRNDAALTPADHAMHCILEAAQCLGMDLGARWGNEIDSTTAD